jgi:hypothetical protein
MMKRLLVAAACVGALGCLDFEGRLAKCDAGELAACAPLRDAGEVDGGGADAGVVDGGAADAGPLVCPPVDAGLPDGGLACPGFSYQCFCWVNPTPHGELVNQLVARGPHDVWAVGQGGQVMHFNGCAWEDHRPPELLTPDFATSVPTSVGFIDGGIVVAGLGLRPWGFVDGHWTSAPSTAEGNFSALNVEPDGTIVAVGDSAGAGLLVEGPNLSSLVDHSSSSVDTYSSVAWGPEGRLLVGQRGRTGKLLGGDGGVLLRSDGSADSTVFTSLWVEGRQAWCGGSKGQVMTYDFASASADAGSLGRDWANSYVGVHAPLPGGRMVLAGNNDLLAEGSPGDVLGGTAQTIFSTAEPTPGPAHTTSAISTIVSDDTGWAWAWETGGAHYVRSAQGQWAWDGAPLAVGLRAAVPIDGGILFVGGGNTLGAVSSASLVPVSSSDVGGVGWSTLWGDAVRQWVGDDDGRLCALTAGKCFSRPSGVNGAIMAIAGPAENLWAVGDQGVRARLYPDGGFHDFTDAAFQDVVFRAAAPFGDAVVAFADMGDGGSNGYLLHPDGGFEYWAAQPALFTIISAAVGPDGSLWAAGRSESLGNATQARLAHFLLDGGAEFHTIIDLSPTNPWPTGDLRALAPVGPNEVWALDEQGFLWHFTNGSAVRVETGVRADLRGLTVSTDVTGHRTLWLVGAWGAIVKYELP